MTFFYVKLVTSIYSPDLWNNVTVVKQKQLLLRPTFGDTGSNMSACFLFILKDFFSPVYAVVKQTSVLSSTPHNELVRKLALSVFPN